VNEATVSAKRSRPMWVIMLSALAVLGLVFAWSGAAKMMRMQTHAASNTEFAQLRPQDEAKFVIEITEAPEGRIRGILLEKQDETHYARTAKKVEASWGRETRIVMGNPDGLRAGAVVHVTGKIAADHSVQASQIVILTGYVQVK
jgi:hypothetical protein